MRGGGDINSALGGLPDKLKTELALHVNLKTLKKVRSLKTLELVSPMLWCGVESLASVSEFGSRLFGIQCMGAS